MTKKKQFFPPFLDIEPEIFAVIEFLRIVFQKGFSCIQGKILLKNVFFQVFLILDCFRIMSEKASSFRRKFPAGWSKRLPRCPRECFDEKHFFEKKLFSDIDRNVSGLQVTKSSTWLSELQPL